MSAYLILLAIHSVVRWLVLASLLFALYRAYRGLLGQKVFSKTDNIARSAAAGMAHLQFILGMILYFISPVTSYFLRDFKEAIHIRDIRFFGMEHITMMLIAIILISVGAGKAKRLTDDRRKFKAMAVWLTIALVIIFLSIPWPFSPFTSRPYFRGF